jgi:PhnB protein
MKQDHSMLMNRSAPHARARLVDPTRDWEYGERQATIEDPFGHQWVLNQTVADVAPEEWGGTTVTPRPSS